MLLVVLVSLFGRTAGEALNDRHYKSSIDSLLALNISRHILRDRSRVSGMMRCNDLPIYKLTFSKTPRLSFNVPQDSRLLSMKS